MDFKVAGTREGVTALQMDIKITASRTRSCEPALEQAKRPKTSSSTAWPRRSRSRARLSDNAPRISTIQIDLFEKIGMVIGKGGETIQR